MATLPAKPCRLRPWFRETVWGTTRLSPWFRDRPAKTGEVWFTPDADFPLLVKFIFTAEKLSVQVHPNDEQAMRLEGQRRGKAEMWYILRAEPGATIALGLRERISPQRLREASQSGEIERLLNWVEVHPGETYFTPPGTIHAIGAGVTLCEIQQNSNITYRLFDYGRARELHLDKAIEVADPGPYPGKSEPQPRSDGVELLVSCDYFETESMHFTGRRECRDLPLHELIVLEGRGSINSEPFTPGEVWLVPAGASFELAAAEPVDLLRVLRR